MAGPIHDDEGRFADWRQLGWGGLGETWTARDMARDCQVVVKVRPVLHASREMCLREASLARKLNSPHLQRFVEFLPGDPGPDALIYDYVDGQSLKDRLRDGPLARYEALSIARDVLAGVGTAHQRGIIHRDISPENVILTDQGAVLIDFDAVGDLVQDSRIGRTTIGGEFAGKPLYMSPEQITGAPQSAASDIWAIGAVLYECVTGESFRQSDTIAGLVAQYAKAPDLAAVPNSVQGLLADMLAPDPARRPDAPDAIASIEALLSMAVDTHGPDGSPRPEPVARLDRALAAEPADFATPHPAARVSKAGAPAALLPGLAILALLGAAALIALAAGYQGAIIRAFREQDLPSLNPVGVALVIGGIVLVILSFFVTRFLRARAAQQDVALPFRALDLINAPDARDRLTETICLRIDAYRDLAGKQSEDLLSVTMVALANEYASAETADERFRALEMLNDVHKQVARSLRPWWMSYETLIARVLSLTTLVAGIVTAIEGVRRLFGVIPPG